ncbi:uncharacterized protein HMPREF1541_05473 [Cyphellophora europaea CBS 101466]|uniref:Zn(2)-C6 fungal-type domain-containing protein n=1 Tax=Cyphellophora europaea (strain CBS 101466) TaxID=1220924 RepID=W2RSF5_CYPE1|nr:uncharacterized protein HMPREF1541_05473 [Cyphellophora europaea CBS 101466]ETN39250.1 hypothetical protein HMPREF1541_05473 [Cyphellophora europaea CBS 101466]
MAPKKLKDGRKKAYAPKVRTGCDTCKRRRIKCDESKPVCFRCQRTTVECRYTPSAMWLFESGSGNAASQLCNAAHTPHPGPVFDLAKTSCTKEEQQGFQFFFSKTVPWICEHGYVRSRDFWNVILPRAFHVAPATRHLITAIGLLDTPVGSSDPLVVDQRCERIQFNYSTAVTELTSLNPHPADVALAPVLAWVFDAMINEESRAEVHAQAMERLTIAQTDGESPHLGLDASPYMLEQIVHDIGRYRCLRIRMDTKVIGDQPLLRAVMLRNRPPDPSTLQELLKEFQRHYETYQPGDMTPDYIVAAEAFAFKTLASVVANVYHSEVQMTIFSALRFLCLLTVKLLPMPIMVSPSDPDTIDTALSYILDWILDLHNRAIPKKTDRELLIDILEIMLPAMRNLTPATWRQRHELDLEQLSALLQHCRAVLSAK